MARIGFTNYDVQAVTPPPTVAELIAALTNVQKTAILNGFIAKILPNRLKHTLAIPYKVIREIYQEIDRVEETSRILMREELLIEDEVLDVDGNVTTPAVYNDAPISRDELVVDLVPNFTDSFTAGQVGAIVDKMIEYSKSDGTGDWAYYEVEVVK